RLKPPVLATSAAFNTILSSCPGWMNGLWVAPIVDGLSGTGGAGHSCHLNACAGAHHATSARVTAEIAPGRRPRRREVADRPAGAAVTRPRPGGAEILS